MFACPISIEIRQSQRAFRFGITNYFTALALKLAIAHYPTIGINLDLSPLSKLHDSK